MIRKFISRVFSGKKPQASKHEPAVIPVSSHGITRDRISSGSRRVCETLQGHGFKAYVVGGAVRDLLIGAEPKDFDIATDATPEEVRRAFRRSRIIGRRFQIVHVMMGQETLEVTTFRGMLDEKTKTDEHGRVLHDNVFGSHADDAARRDFTANALYYDPATEAVIDYHHGVGDLKQKTLRMIGEPRTRYREDPVRMLRAVRLAAKLGLMIDPEAKKPIREMAGLLENVPAARLFDEMLKLLTSGHSVKCITQLRDEGLHHGLLPLLDVILEQPMGEKFVMLSLKNTDDRIRQEKGVSPGFLFATLLWHEVLAHWEKLKAKGEAKIPALYQAMDTVIDVQGEKLAITRRIAGDIKDIWALQPRFDARAGKRPYALLEQPRFRAGYDFLVLRAESGEIDMELADWWTRFQRVDGEERAEMLMPEQAGDKKRRRRKKKPANAGNQDSSPE
ncbi:polynucleotide adenylyltransferase PcnB [Dechloromonas sp. HYN0024]|uniref:polynucleotide adenylyltransferase PcnB n=1 Tax=Dechloromonas sp. HYN0024 TaxID=2231055 RepID=UPI000E44D112|nr:polynucleotide adenylyltransferase PcnB [Dechloromonas sp. HYN0024]AXS79287.1 polynucleotide adenylyltransferase PcnB [Dechloromonas sp. HYN0024]